MLVKILSVISLLFVGAFLLLFVFIDFLYKYCQKFIDADVKDNKNE